MEELILKLTQAINDFNKYLKNEYSSINKNFSGIGNSIGDYSIFTIVAPKLTDYKINKTFPRANYILVSIDNSTDVIYLSVNALTKDKLKFRDGSKFEGIFSDLYLTYDFSSSTPLPKVQIYIGYNSKYNPITAVKIADIDTTNPFPVNIVNSGAIDENPIDYLLNSMSGTLNNNTVIQTFYKNLSSIIICNLSSTGTLYVGGDNFDMSDYNDFAIPIEAGEKFTINFKPLAKSGYKIRLASPDNIKYLILANGQQ